VEHRRLEDIAACAELGAAYRHLPVPDCIYRRGTAAGEASYTSEAGIFGQVNPQEAPMLDLLAGELRESLPDQATLVCPLALGGHVDHKLTRAVVEKLFDSKPDTALWDLWYYADYPYARDEAQTLTEMQRSLAWKLHSYPVTGDGTLAWERAVAEYTSQISTFWSDMDAMKADLRSFASQAGGVRLWQPTDLYQERAF
jgi:LmbE family N-acetylglucosaminyl deacetylase